MCRSIDTTQVFLFLQLSEACTLIALCFLSQEWQVAMASESVLMLSACIRKIPMLRSTALICLSDHLGFVFIPMLSSIAWFEIALIVSDVQRQGTEGQTEDCSRGYSSQGGPLFTAKTLRNSLALVFRMSWALCRHQLHSGQAGRLHILATC